ncbi:hypothetical protein [Pantoea sp. ME81]|uniref:hypothetical protein n=1 Tax=Pantoea sp. ME81 TaxID=2743935 RepID=UPI0015F710B2|nr:hypothetical protein [Pantoea sp. ME81]
MFTDAQDSAKYPAQYGVIKQALLDLSCSGFAACPEAQILIGFLKMQVYAHQVFAVNFCTIVIPFLASRK